MTAEQRVPPEVDLIRDGVDSPRGRSVKTTVMVEDGGKVKAETVNRGEAVTRWVDRVKGKHLLQPVG